MKSLLIGFIFLTSISSFADQCERFSYGAYIEEAKKIVEKAKVVTSFCNSCNDKEQVILNIRSIEKVRFEEEDFMGDIEYSFGLKINNRVEDLAYIYVDGENLGMKIGCNVRGESRMLPIPSN